MVVVGGAFTFTVGVDYVASSGEGVVVVVVEVARGGGEKGWVEGRWWGWW